MLSKLRTSLIVVLFASGLAGCVGSPRPRNPNKQRRDKGPEPTVEELATKPIFSPPEGFGTRQVLISSPKNSWIAHDKDIYRVLPADQAKSVAPVQPWFDPKTGARPARKKR